MSKDADHPPADDKSKSGGNKTESGDKKPPKKITWKTKMLGVVIAIFLFAFALIVSSEGISLAWQGAIASIQTFFAGFTVAINSLKIGLYNSTVEVLGLNIQLSFSFMTYLNLGIKILFALLIPYVGWKAWKKEQEKNKGKAEATKPVEAEAHH